MFFCNLAMFYRVIIIDRCDLPYIVLSLMMRLSGRRSEIKISPNSARIEFRRRNQGRQIMTSKVDPVLPE